jgi:lipoprotein-anchoring transpeptidase ErfK/SrfK
MSLRSSISASAFAAGVLTCSVALANQDYFVIQGMGPGPGTRQAASHAASHPGSHASANHGVQHQVSQVRTHLGHPSMNAAPVAAHNGAHVHANASSGYGGGFIELLVTGRDPSRAPMVNTPPPVDGSHQRFRSQDRGVSQMQFAPQVAPQAAPQRHAALAPDAGFPSRRIHPRFERQEVAYDGRHPPGTIVVDTPSRYLFLVLPNGRAMRYGIGVGRPGFEWAGVKRVTRKAEWPDWRPPAEMLKRRPDLPTFMKGGPDNPLGARALYLGSSLYRIHGTNEPWTIGQNVSSGCIRMMNEDVKDLYQRVRVGTRVVVI